MAAWTVVTLSCADTGGHACGGFDGYGEGGAVGVGVIFHHGGQIKHIGFFIGQAQSHNAAAFTDEQSHLRGGNMFSGKDNIAFIFATFIIDHQHTLSVPDGVQRFFNSFMRGTKGGK